MAGTQAKKRSQMFNARQWGVGADPHLAPPDPNSDRLVATVVGNTPRWISADQSRAIWSASYEVEGESEPRLTTVIGPLGRVNPGEMLSCRGKWEQNKDHGWQFIIYEFTSALPQTRQGVIEWLKSAKINGIGPTFAEAIVDHFGHEEVFEILDQDPTRLREVRTKAGRKIAEKQMENAIAAWAEVQALRQIETFMFSCGIKPGMAKVLYQEYGDEVVTVLRTDPYRITEVKGVGFRKADDVALKMGVALDDQRRIREAVLFGLHEAKGAGHAFLGLQTSRGGGLIGYTVAALTPSDWPKGQAPPEQVRDPRKIVAQATKLSEARKIVVEPDEIYGQRIYLRQIHEIECRLARRFRAMIETPRGELFPQPARPTAPPGATQEDLDKLKLPSDEQWSVIEEIRGHRLVMLMGGPGTGKTQTTKALVKIAKKAGLEVKICAPTGKAARRAQDLTGHPASTIHRLLEFSPFEGGFQRNEENPIEADLIIVDEASMLALDLADDFFRAVSDDTHVLLVGDPDQLPPVGVGKVLDDLIRSEVVPRVHLTTIFRQAARSMIIQNARRINRGQLPYLKKDEAEHSLSLRMLNDFYWLARAEQEQSFATVIEAVCQRLPRTFNFDPRTDIAVLAPMNNGKVGLKRLNAELEARLNPPVAGGKIKVVKKDDYKMGTGNAQLRYDQSIYVGSRIMQTKNDYTEGREVMNGELAMVTGYDKESNSAILSLDDGTREVRVPVPDMDTYQLAWALTVHKSQGSEFPCVVTVISSAHYTMLKRALVYTAVTRASKMCVMVGEVAALRMAVRDNDMEKRNSTLRERILKPALSGELF